MRWSLAAGTALAVVATALVPARAFAVEREHHLGVAAGGLVESRESPDVGASVGAHWAYGVSDAFNVIAEAGWSFLALDANPPATTPRRRPSSIGNADVGAEYVFDVLRWIPYAGAMVGAYDVTGGTVGHPTFLPGAAIALGLDFRVDRNFVVGVAAREHMFLTALSSYPSYSQVLARVEYTWGW